MKIRNMKQVGERVKEIKMKRLFRRNQIIITTLAVMIAAAGYLNYAGKRDLEAGGQVADMGSLELSDEDLMAENLAAQSETVQDILSLDNDPNDTEVAEAQTEGTDLAQAGSENGEQSGMADTEEQTTGNDAPAGYENPGEAAIQRYLPQHRTRHVAGDYRSIWVGQDDHAQLPWPHAEANRRLDMDRRQRFQCP